MVFKKGKVRAQPFAVQTRIFDAVVELSLQRLIRYAKTVDRDDRYP